MGIIERTRPTTILLPLLLTLALLTACAGGAARRHVAASGALGPYSAAVLAGPLCFVSGKIGATGGSFAEEAASAIDAVAAELERAGLGLADVVSTTVYLTDIQLYGEFNAIYAGRFPQPYPARACVAVAALPGNARVEIQVIAVHR